VADVAEPWSRPPHRLLVATVVACCGAYGLCCLLALTLVDEMRDFPSSSRQVMKVLLVVFAGAALLLTVALLRVRRWAARTAIAVGAVGVVLFGPTRLMWRGDPEWADASRAAATVALLVAVGCVALVVAGIASDQLRRRRQDLPTQAADQLGSAPTHP
jgi:ferric-dicitrate binding protein FerR (iron transport regulator)